MKKSIRLIGLLILMFSFGFAYTVEKGFYSVSEVHAEPAIGVSVGKTMPTFTAATLDGGSVQIGGTGTLYVLNFWATWCPPCREEFPELNAFAKEHTQDLQFYSINIQESASSVTNFLQNNGYDLPALLDSDGQISRQFRISVVPTTIVVDSQGVIRYRKAGGVTKQELENVLSNL